MIEELQPNQVFVFGSNSAGHHYGGAAKQAYEKFGALWGKGEGLSGQSYAFPTLTKDMAQLPHFQLGVARDKLYDTANTNQDKEFLLTPVGTGIAGFTLEEIAPLFEDLPNNIKKVGW